MIIPDSLESVMLSSHAQHHCKHRCPEHEVIVDSYVLLCRRSWGSTKDRTRFLVS